MSRTSVVREAPTHALRRFVDRLTTRATRINREPIIVLGQVKSGTTAIAALLAERTASTVTLDIPALFGHRIIPIRTGDESLERVARQNRREFSADIIKQPSMTWLFPQLLESFPRARFVMIIRDPRDNIRSILNRVGLPGDLPDLTKDDLLTVPEEWRWQLQSPDLLGVSASSYIELLAKRWNLGIDVYREAESRMLLVRYEDFVADKIGCIDRCANDLSLPLVNDIDASLDIDFQPRGDRQVRLEAFFGGVNLSAIESVCRPRMVQLGYALRSSG